MLGKLLKYEVGDTIKIFTPFYGIVLFLTLLSSLFLRYSVTNDFFTSNVFGQIIMATLLFITVISFTIIVTMVSLFIISRFYKNLVKQEGYFMHSLPVSPHLLIISKMISSFILVITTIIFAILCAFIFVIIFGELPMSDFLYGLEIVIFDGILTPTFFIGVINAIIFAYASVAMGSLFQNKFLGAVLSYVGYATARSFFTSIISAVFFTETITNSSFEFFWDQTLFMTNVISVLFIVLSYVITYHIFSKQLNLE